MSRSHPVILRLVTWCLAPAGLAAAAVPPPDFATDECDCIIELENASGFIGSPSGAQALSGALSILGAEPALQLIESPFFARERLREDLLENGLIGVRVDGESEWVAWIDYGPEEHARRTALVRSLSPVRGMKGLESPRHRVGLIEHGDGLLIHSLPPGVLAKRALETIGSPDLKTTLRSRVVLEEASPVVVTVRHPERPGGSSTVAMSDEGTSLRMVYHGRFTQADIEPPRFTDRLDVEILDRLPGDAIIAAVEHADAGLLPGEDVISRLLPFVTQSQLPDERHARRVVVVTEAGPVAGVPEELRMPAIAVAIEVDGPGDSAVRQDLRVLASLNSLRNRLGGRAGLQHIPGPDALPEHGTRTIDTRALLDSALEGHPLARMVSVNWCQTSGPGAWQLYATTTELADRMAASLEREPGTVACIPASQAGRLNAPQAIAHLGSWLSMADLLVDDAGMPAFTAGVEAFSSLLQRSETLEWSVRVPDSNAVDALIRCHRSSDEAVER